MLSVVKIKNPGYRFAVVRIQHAGSPSPGSKNRIIQVNRSQDLETRIMQVHRRQDLKNRIIQVYRSQGQETRIIQVHRRQNPQTSSIQVYCRQDLETRIIQVYRRQDLESLFPTVMIWKPGSCRDPVTRIIQGSGNQDHAVI